MIDTDITAEMVTDFLKFVQGDGGYEPTPDEIESMTIVLPLWENYRLMLFLGSEVLKNVSTETDVPFEDDSGQWTEVDQASIEYINGKFVDKYGPEIIGINPVNQPQPGPAVPSQMPELADDAWGALTIRPTRFDATSTPSTAVS